MVKMAFLTPEDMRLYASRISLPVPIDQLQPGALPTLQLLHHHHCLSIPFETFSLAHPKAIKQVGVSTELDDIVKKVLLLGRGGYCFEASDSQCSVTPLPCRPP